MTAATPEPPGTPWLRDLVRRYGGFDPGPVRPDMPLSELDRGGLGRYALICALEDRFAIEFPADLIDALETVDDLLHFTAVKIDQIDGGTR